MGPYSSFLYPATQKVAGYYVIPSELWVSVRPSVCLSVSASFPCSNFSTIWPIFFKLCTNHIPKLSETWIHGSIQLVFIPRHTKSGGVLCYTLRTLSVRPSSVRPSVCLSVSTSFPCSNFSTICPIFFRLCIDIGIGEECPSVRPSVRLSISASFLCSNVSTFWPILFKLCIDIGIGEELYGIASGLISFWNDRVMALDVCQKCFALRFSALTLVPFYRFLRTLHRHWYRKGVVWDCKWENFIQKQQSYGPWFMS